MEIFSPWLLVFLWDEHLHLIGAQVVMEPVHMLEGLVRLVSSEPTNVKRQGGSSMAVATMSNTVKSW